MAVGRIIGGVAGLGLVGASYYGVAGQDESVRNESGTVVESGEVGAFRIQLGDCISGAGQGQFESVRAVPCAEPHEDEVYHAFNLTASGTFPGQEAVSMAADQGCYDLFETFVGLPYAESQLDFGAITPSEGSWNEVDDREVLCVVYRVDGALSVGSARNSGI